MNNDKFIQEYYDKQRLEDQVLILRAIITSKDHEIDIIIAYKESVTALSLLNCAMVLIEESGDSELQIKASPIHQYYKNLTNFKNDIEVRIDTILIAG